MHKAISVIITIRGNEPYLKKTIENVRAKAGCKTEIVAVWDGTPPDMSLSVDQVVQIRTGKGVGHARHKGIDAATHKLVFLTDAHMDFSKDFGKMILDFHNKKENEKTISCGCCVPMFDQGGMLFWNMKEKNTAARFCAVSREPGNEQWVMSGKWAKQTPGKNIGCVYGACYSFTKKWYATIGQPLELLRGWGMDEEYLSAATWMAGGRCVLLGYDAGHLFRARPSFETGRIDAILRWVNRARFVDLLPTPQKIKEDFESTLEINAAFADSELKNAIESDKKRPELETAKKLWAAWDWKRMDDWIDWLEKPLEIRQNEAIKRREIPQTLAAGRVEEIIQHVQMRGVFQCPKCRMINSFRVRHTSQISGNEYRYGKCGHCGLNGVKISTDQFEKIHWRVAK